MSQHTAARRLPTCEANGTASVADGGPSRASDDGQTRGLVLQPNDSHEAFDSEVLSGAVVQRFEHDDHARWVMWYGGRPKSWEGTPRAPPGTGYGLIGLALSSDGVTWERVKGPRTGGAILAPNNEEWWWFDTAAVILGDISLTHSERVRSEGGVYFAYYAGSDGGDVEINGQNVSGARTSIGVALSKDGEWWTRVEGGFASGAVLEPGPPGSFDELGVFGPTVIRKEGRDGLTDHIMYYCAYDSANACFSVGRALSNDGFEFRRDAGGKPVLVGSGTGSGEFDERGFSRCSVVKKPSAPNSDDTYIMFIEAIDGDGTHRIAKCESSDALQWSKPQVVLDVGKEEDAWDAGGVSHPSAVVVGDTIWLYYTGRASGPSPRTGLGLAVSLDSEWTTFRRADNPREL